MRLHIIKLLCIISSMRGFIMNTIKYLFISLLFLVATLVEAAPIHDAAVSGRSNQMQQLLEGGANPDQLDEDGLAPIHWAIRANRQNIVEFLLDNGAAVNIQTSAPDQSRNTPLHFAAFEGNIVITRLLLDNGASIDARSSSGNTPLHVAAIQNNADLIAVLIERGAPVRAINNRGLRPADVAPAQSAALEVLELLGGSDVIFRLLAFYSYDLALNFSTVTSFGSLLRNTRPTIAPQFTFPVGLIAPGFEIGLKLGIETIAGSGSDEILALVQNYLHFITRFSIRADIVTIEITPSLGAFVTFFNNDLLLTPDVGVRVGLNTDNIGSLIVDINYVFPQAVGIGGGLSGFASIYSNSIHFSIGYAL